jgi:hypothetical protein
MAEQVLVVVVVLLIFVSAEMHWLIGQLLLLVVEVQERIQDILQQLAQEEQELFVEHRGVMVGLLAEAVQPEELEDVLEVQRLHMVQEEREVD